MKCRFCGMEGDIEETDCINRYHEALAEAEAKLSKLDNSIVVQRLAFEKRIAELEAKNKLVREKACEMSRSEFSCEDHCYPECPFFEPNGG